MRRRRGRGGGKDDGYNLKEKGRRHLAAQGLANLVIDPTLQLIHLSLEVKLRLRLLQPLPPLTTQPLQEGIPGGGQYITMTTLLSASIQQHC